MDLLEHQGKELFAAAGLPVPAGRVVATAAEAGGVAEDLGLPVAVKAQVRAGGRSKAGGIRVCRSCTQATAAAGEILGMELGGGPVASILVEEAIDVAHEAYVSIVLSRYHRGPLLVVASQGGVDVEELARTRREAVYAKPVDPLLGVCDYQARAAGALVAAAASRAAGPDLDPEAATQVATIVSDLWRVYRERDATLVEVNPLVVTAGGTVLCLDAKVTIDDNALWRHPDLAALGPSPDERESRAHEAGLSYLTLDGHIGVIGNGAGLVMSTLDHLAAAGGRGANFCDVGGGASAEAVALALELVVSDARVKAITVNIFGGITRGDEVARGLIQALHATKAAAAVPLVVRLEGTAAAEGRALLAEAWLPNVRVAEDVDELARLACALGGPGSRRGTDALDVADAGDGAGQGSPGRGPS